jgi:hypothetical protein
MTSLNEILGEPSFLELIASAIVILFSGFLLFAFVMVILLGVTPPVIPMGP